MSAGTPTARGRAAWARLIRKVYEADPLVCLKCNGPMRVIALIDDPRVVRRIRVHLGRWVPEPRAAQDSLNFDLTDIAIGSLQAQYALARRAGTRNQRQNNCHRPDVRREAGLIRRLVTRLYWPKTAAPCVLPVGEGTWKPPGIVQAK